MRVKKLLMITMISSLLMTSTGLASEPISCDTVLDKCAKTVDSQKKSLKLKDLVIVDMKDKIHLVEVRNTYLERQNDEYKQFAIYAFLMAIGAAFL